MKSKRIIISGCGVLRIPTGMNERAQGDPAGIGLLLLVAVVYYPGLDARLVADDFHLVERLSFADALRSFGRHRRLRRNEYRLW